MYNITLNEFRIKQEEMFRQAENYRLVRSAEMTSAKSSGLIQKIAKVFFQFVSP